MRLSNAKISTLTEMLKSPTWAAAIRRSITLCNSVLVTTTPQLKAQAREMCDHDYSPCPRISKFKSGSHSPSAIKNKNVSWPLERTSCALLSRWRDASRTEEGTTQALPLKYTRQMIWRTSKCNYLKTKANDSVITCEQWRGFMEEWHY